MVGFFHSKDFLGEKKKICSAEWELSENLRQHLYPCLLVDPCKTVSYCISSVDKCPVDIKVSVLLRESVCFNMF